MPDAGIGALSARFGIPGQLSFHAVDGMTVAEVANDAATASVAMQGAHLMRWAPWGMAPVIWLSPKARLAPGTPIRGGVPICWPWFGTYAGDAALPSHGFARTAPWELLKVTPSPQTTVLSFRLDASAGERSGWPHAAELMLSMRIGAQLEMELVTHNTGCEPVSIGQALHAYFGVGDVRRLHIEGLDGHAYIDKVHGGQRRRQTGDIVIDGETDRIYLDATADCIIDDPVLARRIRIHKRGSRSTVVWNPGADKARGMGDLGENGYLHMVCVESANAADDVITVAPGGSHRLWTCYRVEA